MAVKIKTKGQSVGTAQDVLDKYKKDIGETVGSYGGMPVNSERVPTGLFPFDLATGGGLPRGRTTIIYGPEDSAKTSVAFSAIRNHQHLWPDLTCVYVAIEPFDPVWAKKMGVDISKLIVLSPSFAEEAVDMIADMLASEDSGLVVLDSIAAMITTQEAEKSAEGHTPGGTGLVVGKLVRQTTLALRNAEKEGRRPTLLYINQLRHKIGVMFGSPETMPGGFAALFQAQLRVRFHGTPIKDSKISDTFPVRRKIEFMLKKCKVPIIADAGMMEMVTYPHNGLNIGETDDIGTIEKYLEDMGLYEKTKKGYEIVGEEYPTQKAFKARVYSDREYGDALRKGIIERILEEHEEASKPKDKSSVDADGVVN